MNPGPRFQCGLCKKYCKASDRLLEYEECEKRFHASCSNLGDDELLRIESGDGAWYCTNCKADCSLCSGAVLKVLHIKVRLTVEGDFRFCWTTTPNVGQTHKENPNLVRILYMVCTLNDIYKQYNKLHENWYTKISSLRCVAVRNPPQNASDLYTKCWSYAEHCRPCTRLSGVNWWKQKQITLIVPIGYSLFADHRSVPSSGPGFFWLISA